jgi:predicted nucleotidyltransferase/plasmid maintenance system antidote protein VapI
LTKKVKMNIVNSERFGDAIRKQREEKELPLRKVAAYLDIDQAILSKIERGKRKATRELVLKLAAFFQVVEDDLLVAWLSDKLVYELEDEALAMKALKAAEEKVAYKTLGRPGRTAMIKKFRSVIMDIPAIERAWLFGSYARQDDTEESDIDVLIDVPEENTFTLFDIAEVQEKLRQLTNRRIDVVMLRALRPQVKERIQQDLKLIYEV